MQYENRPFGEAKYALGEMDDPPPRAECPPGSIRVSTGSETVAVEA